MRLIREIFQVYPQSLSEQELLRRYNAQTILKIRLTRLLGSGDIVFDGDIYKAANKHNFFLVSDIIAKKLQTMVERS